MADNDDIVQKVRVEVEQDGDQAGAFDKIKSSLESALKSIQDSLSKLDFSGTWDKLKDAGGKAFDAFKEQAAKSLDEVSAITGLTTENMAKRFAIAGAAASAVAVVIGIAAKAMFNFTESTAQVTSALDDLAQKSRTSISDLSALQTFFAKNGVGPGEFASAYRRLSGVVAETWTQIKKESEDGGSKLESAHLAAARSARTLADAERELANTSKDLGRQEQSNNDAVLNAKRRLEDLEIAERKASGRNTQAEEARIARDRRDEDTARARQALKDAEDKRDEDSARASEEREKRTLAVRQAQLDKQKAEKTERDAQRNDISTITRGVQELANGNADALKSFNASADNIVKGIVASSAESGNAVQGLGENFKGIAAATPEVKSVLSELGAVLNNIQDPILRDQVAFKALGSTSQEFINALRNNDIDSFISQLEKIGTQVSATDALIAGNFTSSLKGLQDTLSGVGTKVASAFGPNLTDIINSMDAAFSRSKDNIARFAEFASNLLLPFKGLAAAFNGISQTVNTVIDLIRALSQLISSVLFLSDLPITKAFERLLDVLKGIKEILTGNVKQGLEDLQKASKKEREEEDAKELKKLQKEKAEQKAQRPLEPGETRDERFAPGPRLSEEEINRRAQEFEARQLERRGLSPDTGIPKGETFGDAAKRLLDPSTALEGIGSSLKSLLDSTAAFFNSFKNPNADSTERPPVGLGIRGDAETGDQTVQTALQGTATSADTASTSLSKVETPATTAATALQSLAAAADALITSFNTATNNAANSNAGSNTVAAASGGLIQGEGTSTSDSIPARLSDGEYVLKASAVDRLGVPFLNMLNRGIKKFAQGGIVEDDEGNQSLGPGDHEIAYDPNTGGAYIDGVLYFPGHPLLDDPFVKQEIEKSKAAMKQAGGKKGKSKSQFVGFFGHDTAGRASGGHVRGPGTETSDSIPAWLSDNEFVQPASATKYYGVAFMEAIRTMQFPKFNVGGLVQGLMSPQAPRFKDGGAVTVTTGASASQYLGEVDIRTDYGSVRAGVSADSVKQLRRAAVMRGIGTERKPSWVK